MKSTVAHVKGMDIYPKQTETTDYIFIVSHLRNTRAMLFVIEVDVFSKITV